MITGIMVFDDKHEKTPEELVRYGMEVFRERFDIDATHAVLSPIGDIPIVDGLIITQQSYVRAWHALVGIPVLADPIERPYKTEEF